MIAVKASAEPWGALSATEPTLGGAEFRRIAAILYEDSGIHLPEGKASLVFSRLSKRLRRLGLRSFRDYCALVSSPEGAPERQAMLSALTTNVTRFFREPHHFGDLGRHFADRWMEMARRGGRVRFWSAGCSSGEEAYSMAITVLSAMPDAAGHDVKILATDIDPLILERARAGVYSAQSVEQRSPEQRDRWMRRRPEGDYAVAPEVRALVTFRELNLMATWPMKGPFQAIFCRNVAIYFDEASQERLWGRFGAYLAADGRLYIGHSERVGDERFHSDGMTVYRLAGGGAA